MRRFHCAAICAAFLFSCCLRGQGLKREDVERLKQATVYVQVQSRDYFKDEKTIGSGSGFFVHKNGYVITNWHVVRPYGPGFVDIPFPRRRISLKVFANSGKFDEEVLDATVVAVDKEHDLALLATKKADATALSFGKPKDLFETSPLWVAGYPLGEKFAVLERGPEVTVSRGTVTALRHDSMGKLRVIQTDAQFDSGNSGGPLIARGGKVMGIAQSIVVNNRSLNFAVPATFATALMKSIDVTRKWAPKGKVTFVAPPGSDIYLDGKKVGSFTGQRPKETFMVPLGLQQICVTNPDFPNWISRRCLTAGSTVNVPLQKPVRRYIAALPSGAAAKVVAAPLNAVELPKLRKPILAETFDDRKILNQIEQTTGGTNLHTWYVRQGELHQHESNGLLHAAYMGKSEWDNYAFAADVRIKNEQNDSRAGLVFRESRQGFYLFRIHRETDKAQLAYHCKQPFGWFVLGEKKLDVDITEKPNRLQVFADGPNLTCLLNDKPVFRVRDQLAARGRVGFYSVESRAAFDNVEVQSIGDGKPNTTQADSYQMFWYTDTFGEASDWWSNLRQDGKASRPWVYTEAGGVAVYGDDVRRVAIMEKFTLTNFIADLLLKFSKTNETKAPRFGFVFGRRREQDELCEYRLELSANDMKARLLEVRGDRVSILKESSIAPPKEADNDNPDTSLFTAPINRLILRVDGSVVELSGITRKFLKHDFGDKKTAAGTFGFVTQGVDCIYNQLTIANPQTLAPPPPKGK